MKEGKLHERNIFLRKLRGITKLADYKGRFKMMAIDQRGSMVQAARRCAEQGTKTDVQYEDVAALKTLITTGAFTNAPLVLTDPITDTRSLLQRFHVM